MTRPICALTVAGADPGGGAGLQADLKTFHAHGVHGLSVVSALTVQNTRGVRAVDPVAPARVAEQIDALFDDFTIGAVKTGLLPSGAIVSAVARAFERPEAPPLVVDPVAASGGGFLMTGDGAFEAFVSDLLPLAALLTPNRAETERFSGLVVSTPDQVRRAAKRIRALGAAAVLIKGGHMETHTAVDVLLDDAGFVEFAPSRVASGAFHGTGCVLSAAIAARLALGVPLRRAVEGAKRFLEQALERAIAPGGGQRVLEPLSITAAMKTRADAAGRTQSADGPRARPNDDSAD